MTVQTMIAIEYVNLRKALSFEDEGDFQSAYQLYNSSIASLYQLICQAPNNQKRELLQHVKMFQIRLNDIKHHLKLT